MGLLFAWPITLLLAYFSQQLLPEPLRPKQRTLPMLLLEALVTSAIFLIYLVLTQRPILSAILTLIALAIIFVVNQAKFHALREALVFSDAYLYFQVFSHPRLFLPFLNLPLTLGATVAGIALLVFAVWLEPPLAQTLQGKLPLWLISLLLLAICLLTSRNLALNTELQLKPNDDVQQLGLYNSLICYTLQSRTTENHVKLENTLQQSPFANLPQKQSPSSLKDIIVIQSESFFDTRRLCKTIRPNILQNFDNIKAESFSHGQLEVPSWGANTLRPEFAFLSGIDNERLGLYKFNPYQFLPSDTPVPTIASYLKTLGYRCIAIHPNHASFFKRDKVFPMMGFDEFIDIEDFDPQATAGPYISDQAVQEKICEILESHDDERPVFIFAITMENHGPLHLESVDEDEVSHFYQGEPPQHHSDLTVYLRHLKNADQMLLDMTATLQQREGDNLLCFYGDHVPSMPEVYDELRFQAGDTDYLLWQSDTKKIARPFTSANIQQLGINISTMTSPS